MSNFFKRVDSKIEYVKKELREFKILCVLLSKGKGSLSDWLLLLCPGILGFFLGKLL